MADRSAMWNYVFANRVRLRAVYLGPAAGRTDR
jgi:hypothetical protein